MSSKGIFMLPFLLLLINGGCGNNGGNKENIAEIKKDTTKLELKIPDVPVQLSDAAAKSEYLIKNYWTNYNFNDSTLADIEGYTESPLLKYLSVVKRYNWENNLVIYRDFLKKIMVADPKIREKFLNLLEYNLYHPNSLVRDESLYKMVLDEIFNANNLPKTELERYKFQLKMISQNNIGNRANNFSFVDGNSNVKSLYGIKSPYTILIFFDPECGHCEEVIASMKKSPVVNADKVKVVAILTENNKSKFLKGREILKETWISGYDNKEEIMNNLLYDLRPSPSLYLLDKDKKVLLKDAQLFEIEAYLAGSM